METKYINSQQIWDDYSRVIPEHIRRRCCCDTFAVIAEKYPEWRSFLLHLEAESNRLESLPPRSAR